MQQIPAAILMLAAAICGHTAATRPMHDNYGGLLAVIAIGVAFWGGIGLLNAATRSREWQIGGGSSPLQMDPSGANHLHGTTAASGLPLNRLQRYDTSGADYHLPPEISAQVSVVAQMRGKNRSEIVEEILRQHLPRYTSSGRVSS